MKRILGYALTLMAALTLGGCGMDGGGSSTSAGNAGAMSFRIDLNTLASTGGSVPLDSAPTAALYNGGYQQLGEGDALTLNDNVSTLTLGSTITAVHVTLSRAGFADITQDLVVSNNVASGSITNLAPGYWHVVAQAYEGEILTYTGEVDVNVVAGLQVGVQLLFEPADPTPGDTGGIDITVGINPLPGYSRLNQNVTSIQQDPANQRFYILDSSANGLVGVYDAVAMMRLKDIALPAVPQAVALEKNGGALLLGYSTGKLYRLDIESEALTLVADTLVSITNIQPISATFALVTSGSGWNSSNSVKTINLATGQTVATSNYMYPLHSLVHNPVNGMVYALDSGLSPADMHYLKINAGTGAIEAVNGSRYHGDYGFGGPLRIINQGGRIATASGNMFISSTVAGDDITYAGNLGHPLIDIVSDDARNNLYMLNSDNIKKLLVLNQNSLFTLFTVDLAGEPKRVFDTPENIVVFVTKDNFWYVKSFSKFELGLY